MKRIAARNFLMSWRAHQNYPREELCRRWSVQQGSAESRKSFEKNVSEEVLADAFSTNPSVLWDKRFNKQNLQYLESSNRTTKEGVWLDCWFNQTNNPGGPYLSGPLGLDSVPVTSEGQLGDPVRVTKKECIKADYLSNLCKVGQLNDAFQALDSWAREGNFVSRDMLYRVVKGCIQNKDLVVGRRIHELTVRSGYELNTYLANHIIRMYASLGSLAEARQVFRKLPAPDAFVWTSIISAHGELGHADQVIKLYQQMRQTNIRPNDFIYVAVLKACASTADVLSGKVFHTDVIKSGFESNVYVGSALVVLYAKCGNLEDARSVFERLSSKNVVTWNAMIAGYVQHGLFQEALKLYATMQQYMVRPDYITFVSTLKACGSVAAIQEGIQIHAEVLKVGLEADLVVGNTLVDMYAKCGSLVDARRVFDRLPSKDVVTWSTIIAGYAQDGLGQQALDLYLNMQQTSVQPNHITFVSILKACSSIGAISEGKRIHEQILEMGLGSDLFIGNTLLDMYTKCGSLKDAQAVFDGMSRRDVVTWNALIHGYGQHGNCRLGMQCFEEMRQCEVEPDAATFLCLLVACSHAGLVNEGRRYFRIMVEEYSITPGAEHYNCMIDLLGRLGLFADAEDMLQTIPVKLDSVGWRSLLTACKSYGNVELGRRCFNQLIQLEPDHSAAYVLMSNIYEQAGQREGVDEIVKLKTCAGIQKKPATAVIQVNDLVHEFIVGEKRNDLSLKLKSLNSQMEQGGAAYRDMFAAHSSDEVEDALCGHAEKLALAFGLLNTPEGSSILVTKNLRMCDDCHNGTKIISRVERREVIVRDAHRVHRFKDGLCSCGDSQ